MRMNCEIAKQRLSTGGLSNADDRRAQWRQMQQRSMDLLARNSPSLIGQTQIPSAGIYRWKVSWWPFAKNGHASLGEQRSTLLSEMQASATDVLKKRRVLATLGLGKAAASARTHT
jgi:hypothetical protein